MEVKNADEVHAKYDIKTRENKGSKVVKFGITYAILNTFISKEIALGCPISQAPQEPYVGGILPAPTFQERIIDTITGISIWILIIIIPVILVTLILDKIIFRKKDNKEKANKIFKIIYIISLILGIISLCLLVTGIILDKII